MRYLRAVSAAAILLAAACSNREVGSPTSPDGEIPRPSLTTPPPYASPYCTYKDEATLEAAITDLYFKNQWPDPNSALSKFDQVTSALAANNLAAARTATKSLVAFITNKYEHLSNPTPVQTAAFEQLITDLWCFVGISGEVFDLNPGDPAKVFTIPGVGGVWFPPNAVPIGTMVTLTNISNLVAPLLTPLDQFSSYIDIQLIPAHTFTPPLLPIVVICPTVAFPNLMLGHVDPINGFELLAPVNFSGIDELVTLCGPATAPSVMNKGAQGWLADLADRAASFLLPPKLQASMMLFGGIGGSPLRFSPFGATSTTLVGTDGLGGSTLRFTPPVQSTGPAGSPPVGNPPIPEHHLDGAVGTSGDPEDPEWPVVTIKTLGGDADGPNPIPGVTVTFSIGASDTFNPDSEAKVCDAQGAIQASVAVVTDANGVASLPCLKFGNVAGFANLQATFDPSSIGFPGDQLLQINSSVGGSSSTTLNWLVKSNAGVPSALSFVTTPSATGAAGVALAQQPAVQLLDGQGNEVYQAGVDVTVSVSAGGGTVGGTATVATDADGVATFVGISIGGQVAGVSQTLSFGFTGITTPLTSAVSITAGPASQLAITQQPSSTASAGVAFSTQPKVTLQDQFGNTVSSTGNAVASLASGAVTLAGTTTKAAVGGVATFTDLRIDGVAGARTLSFTLDGFTSAASNAITVGAGAATQLLITQQPPSTDSAGVPFTTQPIVAIRDAFGNTVNSNANVVAAISSGAGTLAGTTTIAASGGTATFTNLQINGLIGVRKIRFTSGTLTAAETGDLTVIAGRAASILTSMPPSADAAQFTYPGFVTANAAVSPVPRAIVKDLFGNVISGRTVTWTPVNSSVNPLSSNTNGSGFASVTSWAPGLGESTLLASVSGVNDPATFTASSAIGSAAFMCELGTPDNNFLSVGGNVNKVDVAPIKVTDPKTNVLDVFIYMSVTGQSNTFATYNANVNVYRTGTSATVPGTNLVGSATGVAIGLPGNNGKPQLQHIRLTSPVVAQTSGNNLLWVVVTMVNPPGGRTFQAWYTNLASNKLSNSCKTSFIGTGNSPKQGVALLLKN